MTKDAYFEMCETLGSEPIDSEIPVDLSDFPELVQTALHVYSYLPDIWEGMSGTFMGKDLSIMPLLVNSFEIEHTELGIVLDLISTIDGIRKTIYKSKRKSP